MQSKRFCSCVIGGAATLFALIGLFNFVVDPYAQYPADILPPRVQTSRVRKLELFSQLPSPPEKLILGSSRVLKLEPDYLQGKLDVSFFNAGVNYGKIEDFLALARYYRSRTGRLPQVIVAGLDVYGFSEMIPADARLLGNRLLARQIPEAISLADRAQRWKALLSWQQTKNSLASVHRAWRQNEAVAPEESFREDGLLVYHEREAQIAAGHYDFPAALDYNKREYKQLFAGFERLSSRRISLLNELVDLCRLHNTRLFVFLTPLHPELAEYLSETTTYDERKKDLQQFLARQATARGFVFCDLTTIATFDGDAQAFVDGIHPLEANTRRMIDQLVVPRATVRSYAVQ